MIYNVVLFSAVYSKVNLLYVYIYTYPLFLDSFPIKRIMAIVSLNGSFPLASGTNGHTGQVFLLPFTLAFLLSPLLHYATLWAIFLMLINPLLFIVNYS